MIRGTVGPRLLGQGPHKRQVVGDSIVTAPGFQEEQCRSSCRNPLGWRPHTGRAPETETLGHSPGELGARLETREPGGTEERGPEPSARGGRLGAAIFFPSSKAVRKARREQKLQREREQMT